MRQLGVALQDNVVVLAAAARGAAIQALVAAAVADHDRAAVGAGRRVGRDRERHLRPTTQLERLDTLAVTGMPVPAVVR
jgi:hypothetical protein